MAVVRCAQGHYFDNSRFSSCPYCGITVGHASEEKQQKPEKKKGLFGWFDSDKTIAHARQTSKGSETEQDHTVAMRQVDPGEAAGDDQKTVGLYSGAQGDDYVTGWLVCVKGPEKGRDFRLHHGFNRIGRDFGMDVQVMDDPSISRKNHCSVVYDEKSITFSAVPGSGTVTYCNGELLTKAQRLKAGDELQMGESSFVMIPFCQEGRVWETTESC